MIDVKNLSKTFDRKVNAVKDVSLHVEKGEVVSLIGPSGSGKSTVLRCINGLETPDKGTILINGKGKWPDSNDWYGFMNWGFGPALIIFAVIILTNWGVACLLRWIQQAIRKH